MELRFRHIVLAAVLAVVGTLGLGLAINAAGHGVAVAVTITALVILVATYAGTGILILRSMHDEGARERVRRLGLAPLAVMMATPLVLTAAHPWGVATIALGFGAMVACQLFLHGMIVVASIRHGRARPGATR